MRENVSGIFPAMVISTHTRVIVRATRYVEAFRMFAIARSYQHSTVSLTISCVVWQCSSRDLAYFHRITQCGLLPVPVAILLSWSLSFYPCPNRSVPVPVHVPVAVFLSLSFCPCHCPCLFCPCFFPLSLCSCPCWTGTITGMGTGRRQSVLNISLLNTNAV